jgi:acyl carrier protein
MDEKTLREMVAEALFNANSPLTKNKEKMSKLLSEGEEEIRIDDFELDSLGRMEFCITIELGCGVSIAPEELHRFDTLSALIREIGSPMS